MREKRVNPKIIIVIFAVLCVAIIAIAILSNILRKNPYGKQIVIDNFSKYISGAPQERKDAMFARLYDNVLSNSVEGTVIPESGAVIRDGSAETGYNEESEVYYGRFIVDIPAVKQSYSGYVAWGKNDEADLGGYTTLYTCLPESELIYGDFGCKSMFSDSITTLYPITGSLPIMVEYYANNYTEYVKYNIGYKIDDEAKKVILEITDYTGGNRERALAKIRELGYSPEDFEIQYKKTKN